MRCLFTLLFVLVSSVSFGQTTTTLKVDLLNRLVEVESIDEPIRDTAIWIYANTGSQPTAAGLACALTHAVRRAPPEEPEATEYWNAWENTNQWPLPYEYFVNVGASNRLAIINKLNDKMKDVAIERKEAWETLIQ